MERSRKGRCRLLRCSGGIQFDIANHSLRPLAVFYIKIVSHQHEDGFSVSYSKVATSVAVFLGTLPTGEKLRMTSNTHLTYLGIPLGAAILTRLTLRPLLGEDGYQRHFIRFIGPISLIGLLYTIIVLFASQGAHVVKQITSVLRVCAPLIVYFIVIFSFTVYICRRFGFGYRVSCTQSFTAASNNFELAIAVVVAVYGAGSEEALAATVGPLIEVPVLVALVYILKWIKTKWEWVG
jgi:ACR3 family arsenite transporter